MSAGHQKIFPPAKRKQILKAAVKIVDIVFDHKQHNCEWFASVYHFNVSGGLQFSDSFRGFCTEMFVSLEVEGQMTCVEWFPVMAKI